MCYCDFKQKIPSIIYYPFYDKEQWVFHEKINSISVKICYFVLFPA